MSEAFVPRTERSYWADIAAALNAAASAGMPVAIDLDGTLTDHNAWSVIWDRGLERWVVTGYEDEPAEAALEERRAGGEKDTRGGSPQQGESTPQSPRPRPLPEVSFARARQLARIAGYFRCAAYGREAAAELRGAA
ncbi:hypothetical protein OG529_04175 [Streptomyces longwoodensis]|uniref:hypothetical protein n=1 Tax=Streptomyces longwoodensis TaxID=68231 RepID=UPI00324FEB98